nr:hypothetical protein [Streptomyces hygroscopicus]
MSLNHPAHAHLDSGSGGVASFYALADDGRVDTVVYDISSHRRNNDYQWQRSGNRKFDKGPPSLEIHANAEPLVASRRRVAAAESAARSARDTAARLDARAAGADPRRRAAGADRGAVGTRAAEPGLALLGGSRTPDGAPVDDRLPGP